MVESNLIRLNLCAPLQYIKAPELKPFSYKPEGCKNKEIIFSYNCTVCEQLFCFELNPENSTSIQPQREFFLGPLIFSGCKPATDTVVSPISDNANSEKTEAVRLPSGIYLFTQKQEALGKDPCIDMAIEQQKDGLWEKFSLSDRLYIRYLFEDSKPVTQFFRPLNS